MRLNCLFYMTAEEQYTKAETPEDIIEAMKDFAKYHVEQALNAAFKNGVIKSTKREYEGVLIDITNIVESSIINAYPFENIK